MTRVSRRTLLKALGWGTGGIIVLGGGRTALAFPVLPSRGAPSEADAAAWVSLRPGGEIELFCPRMEMGQGIAVGLRQIVAEETGVSLDVVRCRLPDTSMIPPVKATVGSDSLKDFGPLLAQAAAALETAMREKAATILGKPPGNLAMTGDGYRSGVGGHVSLARLAEGKTVLVEEDQVAAAKPTSLLPNRPHKVVGQPHPTEQALALVTAKGPVFTDDVKLPGQVYGAVVRAQRFGAEIAKVDDSACRAIKGYLGLYRDGDFIAIAAERRGALEKAMAALMVAERAGPKVSEASIAAAIDVNSGLAAGALEHVIEGDDMEASDPYDIDLRFEVPMAGHVPMEPRVAVARFDDDGRLEIWTGSQDAYFVRDTVADELHLAEEDVIVHTMRIGGGFGGKALVLVELEAARLARLIGRPVKLQWTRREEFFAAYQRPPYSHRIRARLSDDGRLDRWWHAFRAGHVIFTSAAMGRFLQFITSFVPDFGTSRGAVTPYAAGARRIEFEDVRIPIPTGPWRGLGAGPNCWAIETAMDALARKSDRDPVAFRLAQLGQDRQRLAAVLKTVADRADWRNRRSGPQLGFGVACGIYKDMSYAAVVAEVRLDEDGDARVSHLWCAHDCGLVINPDQVRAQIEGNLVWDIGMVLHEHLLIEDGQIAAESQADYPMPRFSDVPDIDIALIGEDNAPTGAGETVIVAAAAITNAITAATGETVTRLPYGT